tara:strand:+ start:234 stop:905 length:672 start_codon:yes stop_codon:yes gene_type:complete
MKIAIDGTAASGKGTLARRLANSLGCDYLDTGLLYRAIALEASRHGMISLDGNFKEQFLKENIEKSTIIKLTTIALGLALPISESPDLRSQKISSLATIVASFPEIRTALVEQQRNFANSPPSKKGAVLDGRDIGSVILPEADFKFFIDAKPEIRAKRRFAELKDANSNQTQEIILEDLNKRDRRDSTRKIAPLKRLSDAFFIDSSALNADEVLQIALNYING